MLAALPLVAAPLIVMLKHDTKTEFAAARRGGRSRTAELTLRGWN
jgi:hypothetical protein